MPLSGNSTPILTAVVAGVRKTNPQEIYVGLTVGKDDGIKKGHEFNVTRGGSFVGKVKVTNVWPDRCVAISIPAFTSVPLKRTIKPRRSR